MIRTSGTATRPAPAPASSNADEASRAISPPSNKTSPTCIWKCFPPQHTTLDKAHGRLEVRRIWTSTELPGYLDFPYAAQVFRLQRETTRLNTGEFRSEIVHGVTSLSPEKADPVRLLSLNRHHGCIENGLHYVRDLSFDEDRCRIRKFGRAQVMASLRNLAISLLRLAGAVYIAPALRACERDLRRLLRLLGPGLQLIPMFAYLPLSSGNPAAQQPCSPLPRIPSPVPSRLRRIAKNSPRAPP